jgi:hypothetical protein
MNDLKLLIAEIQKSLAVLGQIRDFIDATERRELAVAGDFPCATSKRPIEGPLWPCPASPRS